MLNLLEYTFSIEDAIRFIPVVFALLLASRALLIRTVFSKSKYFLASLFSLLAIIQFELFIYNLGLKQIARHFLLLFIPSIMALLPVNYLFLKSLSFNIIGSPNRRSWVHLIVPFLVFLLISTSYTVSLSFPTGSENHNLFYGFFWQVIDFFVQYVFFAQTLVYLILIVVLLRRHKKSIADLFSYDENISLRWTTWVVFGYIVFSLTIVFTETTTIGNYRLAEDLLILIYLFFIQHFALKQMLINKTLHTLDLDDEKTSAKSILVEKHKYENSALKDEIKIRNITEAIREYVEKEKPYLDPQLSIHKISEAININSKYLSQAINQEMDSNFIAFVNRYRVEEAKRLMKSGLYENYTIEAIGHMAGFNSKTTFYKAFKKLTGRTPAEYKASPGQ